MKINFLEQLVAEWYEYRGYFVRRNVLVGKLKKGGYECELDVVAFNPETKKLIHIEPSMDAHSWAIREKRFKKKFDIGRKHIPDIFKGINIPNEIEQIALLVFAGKKDHASIGGGKIMIIDELLGNIFEELRNKSVESSTVSEQFTILRTLQFAARYWKTLGSISKGTV